VSETSISFNNESGSETFTVVLNTMPENDVVVRVSSSDSDAVTVRSGATQGAASVDLTFTGGSGGNWASLQTVTVEPVSDADVGDESVTLTVAVQSGPYSVPSRSVAVTVTDNTTGNLVLVPTSLTVDEGGNDTYTVVLSAPGKTDVTVKISSADTAVATVSHSSLTFTPQNYATPQTVTVYGTQDEDSTNNTGLQIGHTASGGGYDISTAQNVTVTVTDDDTPSLVMSRTELTVNEGGTGTYTVKLNTQPTGSVTVDITGAGGNNEVTIDKSSLVFTTENWNSAQTVMVTGVEDDDDQNGSTTIGHTASGGGFAITQADNVQVTVTDNDQPELLLSTDKLTVAEASGTGTYTVRLKTLPTGNVTVAITMQPTGKATVDKTSLTFTTNNWNQTQTVTVTGVPDDADLADDVVTLAHQSSGGGYNVSKDLSVTVDDDDTMTWTFDTPSERTVAEGDSEMITLSVNIAAPSNEERVFGITVVVTGATHPAEGVTGDYSLSQVTNGTVTISGGATSAEFTVQITDDTDDDDGESISIVVSSVPAGVAQGAISVVTIHIEDNDPQQ
jgi:hypothetical protein